MPKRIRPQVFVGSSKRNKRLADAIHKNLDDVADVTVWDQNVFQLTKSALENLLERLERSDFAIFVFAPEDILTLRKRKFDAVRDNVVFELGLFMGRLGPRRTFIVAPKGQKRLRIPTDLSGITVGTFNPDRQDGNFEATLSPFCTEVTEQLRKLGPFRTARRRTRRKRARGK